MKLRFKIILPKILLFAVLGIAFTYLFVYLTNTERTIKTNQARLQQVIQYSNKLDQLQREIENNVLMLNMVQDDRLATFIRTNQQEIKNTIYQATLSVRDTREGELLQEYSMSQESAEIIVEELISSIQQKNKTTLASNFDRWNTKSQVVHATLDELVNYNLRSFERSTQLFQEIINTVSQIVFVILAIIIVLTIVNLYYLNHSITRPLILLAHSANDIAGGKFDTSININRTDEIGQLARSLTNMAQRLKMQYEYLQEEVQRKTEELTQSNVELARSNRELEDFAYVASHDLQEPLRKIQAFANLLVEEHKTEMGAEPLDYINRMRSAAERMSTLIADLLSFSRVTTKAQPFISVDLNEEIKLVLSNLENRLENTKGTIDIAPLPTIMADPVQIRQLFQNLLSNALKFHKPDVPPVVTVTSAETYDADKVYNTFYIKDNGIGIDQKYFDRIFTVFQRLHSREEYDGTGIGLAVVRKIVERHGGKIEIESTRGEGSTFIITLPK